DRTAGDMHVIAAIDVNAVVIRHAPVRLLAVDDDVGDADEVRVLDVDGPGRRIADGDAANGDISAVEEPYHVAGARLIVIWRLRGEQRCVGYELTLARVGRVIVGVKGLELF